MDIGVPVDKMLWEETLLKSVAKPQAVSAAGRKAKVKKSRCKGGKEKK